ncbi:MAG: hypothetical protein P4L57_07705 [Rhizomicrobium sp.]|nr:hypothetical protein [Rhizomicrobium sp.]
MSQVADAVVLGFSKTSVLVEHSFAPLRQLRQEGHLRNIHYVTWDSPELDRFVAPVEQMADVQITRVPQPVVSGTPPQKTLVYQTHNLNTALSLIKESDTVVLKTRPDFIANTDFLRDKLANFERHCGHVPRSAWGVPMPKPVLRKKVWLPWADSNQFFFFEDSSLIGLKVDLAALNLPVTPADLETLEQPLCEHYYHIARYAKTFLPGYPMIRAYLDNFKYLTNYPQYRLEMLAHVINGSYFLFLVIAHAWIMHSQFHVDCGTQDTLRFYPNLRNMTTDWEDPTQWRLALPYDEVAKWRFTEEAGLFYPNIKRVYGRQLTDGWQKAIFSQKLPDFPHKILVGMLEHISRAGDGRLRGLEDDFYRDLKLFYARYMASHAEAIPKVSAWPHAVAQAAGAATGR